MAEKKPSARRALTAVGATTLVAVPAGGPGCGLGHLQRALRLLRTVGERGRLFVGKPLLASRPEIHALLKNVDPQYLITDPALIPDGALAVFDSRRTDAELFSRLSRRVYTVGIDEGGPRRPSFHFLIDTLPLIIRPERPNVSALPVPLPDGPVRDVRLPFRRVLLSFGGEDEAGLSRRLLTALLENGYFPPEALTVIEGPLFRPGDWPAGVTVLRDCGGLDAVIGGYDLLFTHYGLSAYEALLRGVPVILFNPSSYHRRLARADGIPDIGVGAPDLRRLARRLGRPDALAQAASRFRERKAGQGGLAGLLSHLAPQGSPGCPVCGKAGGRALGRFSRKTYFRCPRCGIIRLVFWGAPKVYGDDYFSREYHQQYGKTYLEDFDHIRALGRGRLDRIATLVSGKGPCPPLAGRTLLDVGAAYGPFLAAAGERGLEASGLEIAEEAAAHVRERLGLECLTGDFETETLGVRLRENSFDIITMWYVLEHFVPAGAILRKVNRLLKPGGVLALATPSACGISYRKNRRAFLRQSPDDHFTVWSPRTAARVLRRFGFRVKKKVVTGHHPERFGTGAGGRTVRRLLGAVSRLFGLGDTFEAYAVKERDCV